MSLTFSENVSLKPFNTLAIDVRCRFFTEITRAEQLPEAIHFAEQHDFPLMILGGGSNIVLSTGFSGLVVKVALKGIEVERDGDTVWLNVAAGEDWHGFVCWCLQQGYYGLENLSLIPGTAGAAPIQNIGAYGVELASVLESVTGWDLQDKKQRELSREECLFSYRDSIFKQALRDTFIITAVRLRLSRAPNPNIAYKALGDYLAANNLENPTPQQVAEAVVAIRQSKLPDPAVIPNAGSFFKNPVVSKQRYTELVKAFPGLVSFPQPDGDVKLAAGWLVEQAGWKGKAVGPVGVHHQQSLVLVNRNGGTGEDILGLAEAVKQDVCKKFNVNLHIEPRVY